MYLKDLAIELEISRLTNQAVELLSSPGTGKSDFVLYFVDWLKKRYPGKTVGFGKMFLATYTPIDLLGYMIPTEGPDGTKISTFTKPLWLYSTEGKLLSSYDIGILFIDEYGQGEPDVKKGSAELLLHGEVGPHKLGPNVMRIAASNRSKDRSGVTKSLDFVINRRREIYVESNYASWEPWAIEHNIPPIFMFYARKYGDEKIFNGEVPKEQGPWCTPRSFVMAINYLEAKAKVMAAEGIKWEHYGTTEQESAAETGAALKGIIGEAVANDLIAFIRLRDALPDFEEIVKDPENVKLPSTPDARYMAVHECAYRVTTNTMKPVVQFILRLPQEYAVTFGKTALARNGRLLTNPDFMQFVRKNQSLINAFANAGAMAA